MLLDKSQQPAANTA